MNIPPPRTPTTELVSRTTRLAETDENGEEGAGDLEAKDLKRQTARGAFFSTAAQAATFLLRAGSFIVLARLLLKEDFGLVNMVTAFTGFLGLLRDSLSMATVQCVSVTTAQTSTLFWINLGVGGLLAFLTAITAPLLVAFYGEPRLYWVAVALSAILIFNGAGAQHRAMLQRNMRFAVLAMVDLVSLLFSVAIGIGMAFAGYSYWALVAMMLSQPAVPAPARVKTPVAARVWWRGQLQQPHRVPGLQRRQGVGRPFLRCRGVGPLRPSLPAHQLTK
jgi:uncharacterized membrane protein